MKTNMKKINVVSLFNGMNTSRKAGSLLGDGWTLPIIEHIFKFINIK